jgi:thiol-disulfide isomerase/thioredoxin
MKRILLLSFIFLSLGLSAQVLDNINVKSLKNKPVKFKELLQKDAPTLVSFWATWCAPCVKELTAINKVYDKWQKETNVKIIAISVDNARFSSKVRSFVRSKHWKFDVYTDQNQDLKRSLNVSNIPHIILFDKDMNIVWEHTSYVQGSEEEIYNKIKELGNEE